MLVYFIYVLCHLLGTEKNLEFLGPASEKWIYMRYSLPNEEKSLFWYKSAYLDNIA